MKIGLHSGPVTGGVLRGEKSRFQLFGDTMDNAFTVENNGEAGKVLVSQATADFLKASGKASWLMPSKKMITLKNRQNTAIIRQA